MPKLSLSLKGKMDVVLVLSTLCSCLQRLFSFVLQFQSIANLDYLPAASPNSYFTGLPLLIQPSELCIIHPQHVVDMKCRNTFSGNINNSCSEKRKQNAKYMGDWNVEGNNSIKSVTSYVSRAEGKICTIFNNPVECHGCWLLTVEWLEKVKFWSSRVLSVIIEFQRSLHLWKPYGM